MCIRDSLQYMTKYNNPALHTDTSTKFGVVVFFGDNNHPNKGVEHG